MSKRIFSWASALLLVGAAHAQTAGVVTLRASPTSGTGTVTPTLTWSTNPVATSCRASGGWSGTRAASGTQAQTTVNANTNYTLTCTWGVGSARVSWTAPTQNTDGSSLTNLARFRILYGTSSTSLTQSQTVSDPTLRTATVSGLSPGTWYFAVRAVNTNGTESDNSNVASKSVTGASSSATASVTVTAPTPVPPPPPPSGTLRTTSQDVYDVVQQSNGTWSPRAIVGRIALGATCSTAFTANGGYYRVGRTDGTMTGITLNGTFPWSKELVARCSTS
jgi:hypothetical protein